MWVPTQNFAAAAAAEYCSFIVMTPQATSIRPILPMASAPLMFMEASGNDHLQEAPVLLATPTRADMCAYVLLQGMPAVQMTSAKPAHVLSYAERSAYSATVIHPAYVPVLAAGDSQAHCGTISPSATRNSDTSLPDAPPVPNFNASPEGSKQQLFQADKQQSTHRATNGALPPLGGGIQQRPPKGPTISDLLATLRFDEASSTSILTTAAAFPIATSPSTAADPSTTTLTAPTPLVAMQPALAAVGAPLQPQRQCQSVIDLTITSITGPNLRPSPLPTSEGVTAPLLYVRADVPPQPSSVAQQSHPLQTVATFATTPLTSLPTPSTAPLSSIPLSGVSPSECGIAVVSAATQVASSVHKERAIIGDPTNIGGPTPHPVKYCPYFRSVVGLPPALTIGSLDCQRQLSRTAFVAEPPNPMLRPVIEAPVDERRSSAAPFPLHRSNTAREALLKREHSFTADNSNKLPVYPIVSSQQNTPPDLRRIQSLRLQQQQRRGATSHKVGKVCLMQGSTAYCGGGLTESSRTKSASAIQQNDEPSANNSTVLSQGSSCGAPYARPARNETAASRRVRSSEGLSPEVGVDCDGEQFPPASSSRALTDTVRPLGKLPLAFLRYLEEGGGDPVKVATAMSHGHSKRYIRLNTRSGCKSFAEFPPECRLEKPCHLQPVAWLDPSFHCASLPASRRLIDLEAYSRRLIFGVDAASLFAVQCLDIQQDHDVLDLCCAPGSKMFAIADRTRKIVVGVDVNATRLGVCRKLAAQYGVYNCILVEGDGTKFNPSDPSTYTIHQDKAKAKKAARPRIVCRPPAKDPTSAVLPKEFDRVLVDAECTHDGSIRHLRKYDWQFGWDSFQERVMEPERLKKLPALQLALLKAGWQVLKPGGKLVYSTCSLCKDQNQKVVEAFLQDQCAAEGMDSVLLPGIPFELARDGRPDQNSAAVPAVPIDLNLPWEWGCAADSPLCAAAAMAATTEDAPARSITQEDATDGYSGAVTSLMPTDPSDLAVDSNSSTVDGQGPSFSRQPTPPTPIPAAEPCSLGPSQDDTASINAGTFSDGDSAISATSSSTATHAAPDAAPVLTSALAHPHCQHRRRVPRAENQLPRACLFDPTLSETSGQFVCIIQKPQSCFGSTTNPSPAALHELATRTVGERAGP